MIKSLRMGFLRLILAVPALLVGLGAVAAQGEPAAVRIMQLNTAEFPQIDLRIIATDAQNNALSELSDLSLSEDGQPVANFERQLEPVGVDLTFVIDANSTFDDFDEPGGLTRLEKVRDSIVRYATRTMDAAQRDRVSIVVPDGEKGAFLGQSDMPFVNEVINTINLYEPSELSETTPLNEMLLMATDHAASHDSSGRYQAIILVTDGARLAEQLDYDMLVEAAGESETTVYGLILGNRADPAEVENMTALTAPTGGSYQHMPDPDDADALYGAIQAFGEQTLIRYRSQLSDSGRHTITAGVDGARAEVPFELTVEPPQVQIAVDNSQPIRRVASEPEMPLTEIEPRAQPLVAEVKWPDGHPRPLTSADLVINGTAIPLEAPVLSADGYLTFDWDISELNAGVYELQVQVTDELGLASVSQGLPLRIEVVQLTPPATQSPEPTPQPQPAEEPISTRGWLQDNLFLLVGVLAGLFVIGILFLVLVALFVRYQSSAAALPGYRGSVQAGGSVQARGLGKSDQVDSVAQPALAGAAGQMVAYLEPVEYATEYPEPILLEGPNVALGRDPRIVQVQFADKSVSRLHARILASHGLFRIYDEGSSSGTYVNFERLGLASRTLSDNDHIHLGRVHLRFRMRTMPENGNPES